MNKLCGTVIFAAAFFAVSLSLSLPSFAAQQQAKPGDA